MSLLGLAGEGGRAVPFDPWRRQLFDRHVRSCPEEVDNGTLSRALSKQIRSSGCDMGMANCHPTLHFNGVTREPERSSNSISYHAVVSVAHVVVLIVNMEGEHVKVLMNYVTV